MCLKHIVPNYLRTYRSQVHVRQTATPQTRPQIQKGVENVANPLWATVGVNGFA